MATSIPRSSTHKGVSESQRRESSPSPLERRVSFWAVCGVSCGAPPDERKSFMKFCVTDAIRPVLFSPRQLDARGPFNRYFNSSKRASRSYFPAAFSALP